MPNDGRTLRSRPPIQRMKLTLASARRFAGAFAARSLSAAPLAA